MLCNKGHATHDPDLKADSYKWVTFMGCLVVFLPELTCGKLTLNLEHSIVLLPRLELPCALSLKCSGCNHTEV